MCLTFQILSSEIQKGLFIKSVSQTPSYMKFREQFLLLCINLSLMFYPWKNLLLIQTLPFTDKKSVLGRLFPIHTRPPHTYRDIYMYTHRERGVCSGCYGSLCTKSETLTVSSSKGKSVLLLISSFLLPSNCLCPFILQAASNSCQVSQAETEMFPTSCSHQK